MNLGFFPFKAVLAENSKWLALSVIIFFLGFIFFFAGSGTANNETTAEISKELMESFEALAELILGSHPFYASLFLFINNFISSFQMLVLGIALGLSPLFTLLLNGSLLGAISGQMMQQDIPALYLIVGILPHGIPELGAFFISAAMGLKIGIHGTISPLPGKNRIGSIKYIWKEIISLLPLIVALLLLAAFIEIYVTKNLIELFFLNY